MPAKSKAQQRKLYATKGEAWVKAHDFDNPTKNLPEHVAKKKATTTKHKAKAMKKTTKRRSR